jgi:broad specificity phosphatase PhoE
LTDAQSRFLMIRHGRTTGNAAGVLMGRTDTPLLPASLQAASDLGQSLNLTRPAAIYSSDQPRALHTAHLIGRPSGLRPLQDPQLRERDFGVYRLTPFAELEADPQWPAVDTHYDVRPTNGESLRDVEVRVFARLLHLHHHTPPEATLVLVGHSTCWRLVEAVLLGRRHD